MTQPLAFGFLANRIYNAYTANSEAEPKVTINKTSATFVYPGWNFSDDFRGTLTLNINIKLQELTVTETYFDQWYDEEYFNIDCFDRANILQAYDHLTTLVTNN